MQYITDIKQLNDLKSNTAVLILFGARQCAVCQSIRPKLTTMLAQQFPQMQGVYVDCETSADICAQHSVFSLPVVSVYIETMKIAEEVRAFSIKQLAQTIERPYEMWKNQ
ncbi:MAG: thioredoxin family protein [Gammaproteobacteria bacterium]|nr:thioredoxin family protein [Gammaproteobacteria bacterium]